MAINEKHIRDHRGKQEYTGEETSNIVLAQTGVDILSSQNDLVTAGGTATIAGATDANAMDDVKGWVSITSLGDSDAKEVTCQIQVKKGHSTYTTISLSLPLGITLYGPFYYIKLTDTVSNNEALYCVRG